MAGDCGIWKCHPDLEPDCSKFREACRRSAKSDLTSDLWMNFWRCELPSLAASSEPDSTGAPQDNKALARQNSSNNVEMPVASDKQAHTVLDAKPLTKSQQQQIEAIALELLDICDMVCESLPDGLKEDICSLSHSGMTSLLTELRSRLTDQAVYNFCNVLCDNDESLSTAVPLTFEHIFLPMLCEHDNKALGEEVKAGLKQLTKKFPAECTSYLLKPFLLCKPATPSLLELLSELVPSLPEKDFLNLLQYFIQHCTAPIDEKKISVLSCLLSTVTAEVLETRCEFPLLDLLPILTASARALTASEPFASLLLKVIPALKGTSSSRVHNDLVAIVQQNNSFNKQTLMNAVNSISS